jgi:hypothetical protein
LSEFDWGKEKNLKVYGNEEPPEIDYKGISKQNTKVMMIHGEYDGIVTSNLSLRTQLAIGNTVMDGFI